MPIARRALPGLLALPGLGRAQGAGPRLVLLSDLHSAQEGAAALLGAVARAVAGRPAAILINGDVFERGNVVALRSGGALDWALLGRLRALAPVVLNLGNHETALLDDMAETVRRARALDLVVLSNLRDRRSAAPFAEASLRITLGGRRLVVAGIATDEIMTYRAPVRPTLDIPAPAEWGRAELPALLAAAEIPVVLSHAGVVADRAFLPALPDGTLLVGGHEHLRFVHAAGRTRYVHTGSWNRFAVLADWDAAGWSLSELPLRPGENEDAAHARAVAEAMAAHLTPAEREVLGSLPRPLPLGEAARFATRAIAAAAQGTTGAMAHTSFGNGLPAGPVTRFAFDAFLRFDGPLFRGEAGEAALAALAARANQDGEVPLGQRVGDFAHADPLAAGAFAVNGWVRLNALRYLGQAEIAFAEVPGLRVKQVVAEALRGVSPG